MSATLTPYGFRMNNSGLVPPGAGRSSFIYRNVIPALGSVQVSIPGIRFYVIAASGLVRIKPQGQAENNYYPGTGLNLREENQFASLELTNPSSSNALFVEIFLGFDSYEDKRLVYPSTQFHEITFKVFDYIHDVAATTAEIPDRSGQLLTAVDGSEWYAIKRLLLYVTNEETTAANLVRIGQDVSGGGQRYLGSCFASQSLQYPWTGDLKAYQVGGGNLLSIISETYQCLPK